MQKWELSHLPLLEESVRYFLSQRYLNLEIDISFGQNLQVEGPFKDEIYNLLEDFLEGEEDEL